MLEGLDLLPLFDGIAGGDRFPVKKPDPGHLLGLIAELGAEPGAAAMIGDNENDAAAARAAGRSPRADALRLRPRRPRITGRRRAARPFLRAPRALERLGLTATP